MVASAATAAFFPVATASSKSSIKPGGNDNLDTRGIGSSKLGSSGGGLKVKANAQVAPKINGTAVAYPPASESLKSNSDDTPHARTFINQLPDWSVLLTAITAMFLAAEKQWTLLDWKPRRSDMLVDPFGLGKIVQDGLVFQQSFSIRSYEIGIDGTTSIESFMNHLQVKRKFICACLANTTALNVLHCSCFTCLYVPQKYMCLCRKRPLIMRRLWGC